MPDIETLPIVTSNGTDRRELIQQRMDVLRALHAAEDALGAMYPNGRDYIGELGRFAAAREQHEGWSKQLRQIRSEVNDQAHALQKGAR